MAPDPLPRPRAGNLLPLLDLAENSCADDDGRLAVCRALQTGRPSARSGAAASVQLMAALASWLEGAEQDAAGFASYEAVLKVQGSRPHRLMRRPPLNYTDTRTLLQT